MSTKFLSRVPQVCNCKRWPLQSLFPKNLSNQYSDHTASQIETNLKPSFKELLDVSLLMKFGRADNKCVVGRITDVCNDDLYVDYGAKFEAVVKLPEESKTNFYKKGALVRLILKKFEMTGAFLGDSRHVTLCEADAILVGPFSTQFEERRKQQKPT